MITIINDPTGYQLDWAWYAMNTWGGLKYLPEWMHERFDWQLCLRSDEVLWQPILFAGSNGIFGAVIWFTDHDAQNKTAQIHFCAIGNTERVALFRACRRAVEQILESGALNLIFANHAADHPHAGRMAEMMGFREYARIAGNVYRLREAPA